MPFFKKVKDIKSLVSAIYKKLENIVIKNGRDDQKLKKEAQDLINRFLPRQLPIEEEIAYK